MALSRRSWGRGPVVARALAGRRARAPLVGAALGLLSFLWLPRRACSALLVLALGIYLSLINQTSTSPYFEQTLFMWEQGRFIRFHGLAQWLGWLWPFATLVYVLSLLWNKEPRN